MRSSLDVARAAVAGHPVAHSLSPAIFSYLAETTGRAIAYGRIDVTPEGFREAIVRARNDGFTGVNVTMPNKAAAAALADERIGDVATLDAANVLHFTGGRIVAHNTDVAGFRAALDAAAVTLTSDDTVVVYGAGGAAAAVVLACARAGAGTIAIVNRTPERAERLAVALAAVPGRIVAATTDVLPRVAVFVNATPSADPFVAPRAEGVAIDLSYRPRVTPFMEAAARRGMRTAGGLAMLVGQALETYEIWFGALADRAAIARALTAELEAMA